MFICETFVYTLNFYLHAVLKVKAVQFSSDIHMRATWR